MNKFCNKCGKKKKFNDEDINNCDLDAVVEASLFSNIEIRFGYGSQFDMTSMNFCICEDCLIEFTESMTNKPTCKEISV